MKRTLVLILTLCMLVTVTCSCQGGESVEVTESSVVIGGEINANTKSEIDGSEPQVDTIITTSKTQNSGKKPIGNSTLTSNNNSIANNDNNTINGTASGVVFTNEELRYKPTSLTVTLYDSQNSVYGFTFNTMAEPINPVIQLKKKGTEFWYEYSLSTVEAKSYKNHNSVFFHYVSKTQITLEPNSTYIYRACDTGASMKFNKDICTAETTLKTKNTKAKAFTFAHVSDTQEDPGYFKRVLSSVTDKVDFLLHTGDIVQASIEQQWTDMLDGNFEYLSRIPMMPISGNHEMTLGASGEVYKHFNNNIPTQSSTGWGYFYSFIYGDVKFIMLNTNDLTGKQLKTEQYNWLVNELKTNSCKWTMVALHNPLYSVGHYGSKDNAIALALQKQLKEIFAQYGVDIVLQGHDHTISRTYPINGNGVPQKETIEKINGVEYSVDPSGVIYVMNGTSGIQNGNPVDYDKSLYSYGIASKPASWAEITVDGDKLTVTVKYSEGKNDKVYYKWGIKK